ncbi:GntR family transcriptional regulator [Rhodobacteraceae bacterium N5(2021)]|uniref:GntR family transcriptional regulator n=1 Tax=Gymnodinialimonas phycosphaerae TaxID=2841589 RepID=A0A975YHG1_9RHOB|nr:GntR family transcriptional regulator [Gymnodinialimonas phycosphaerae]
MTTQTTAVIDLIIARIDAGTLLPGHPIDEKEMMAECGVSRTPVREALIRLEVDGLVARNARKGAVIFQPSVAEFLTILEVHANLEAFAAGLAAQRITDALASELRDVVAGCTAHAAAHGHSDPAGYYQLNLRFHEVIVRAAHNDILADMVKTNARKLMAYYRMRYRNPGAAAASAEDHAAIASHILAHRASEAQAAMSAHFNYDRQTVMDLIASVG